MSTASSGSPSIQSPDTPRRNAMIPRDSSKSISKEVLNVSRRNAIHKGSPSKPKELVNSEESQPDDSTQSSSGRRTQTRPRPRSRNPTQRRTTAFSKDENLVEPQIKVHNAVADQPEASAPPSSPIAVSRRPRETKRDGTSAPRRPRSRNPTQRRGNGGGDTNKGQSQDDQVGEDVSSSTIAGSHRSPKAMSPKRQSDEGTKRSPRPPNRHSVHRQDESSHHEEGGADAFGEKQVSRRSPKAMSPKRHSSAKNPRPRSRNPTKRASLDGSSHHHKVRKGHAPPVLAGAMLRLEIIEALDLVAKDRNMLGQRTSSDPYIIVYVREAKGKKAWKKCAHTAIVYKTVNPEFHETLKLHLGMELITFLFKYQESSDDALELCFWDHDDNTDDDFMGCATIPIFPSSKPKSVWFPVQPKSQAMHEECTNAQGKVHVRLWTEAWWMPELEKGEVFPLKKCSTSIQLQLHYNTTTDSNIQVDVSCVAVDGYGSVAWDQCLYFAQPATASMTYINDDNGGSSKLSTHTVDLDLQHLPSQIVCVYYVVHVASPHKATMEDLKDLQVRCVNPQTGVGWVRFVCPISPTTSQVVLRLARMDEANDWVLVPVAKPYPNSRDFGTLVPKLKALTRDLVPSVRILPEERMSLFRPGSTTRILDYTVGDAFPDLLEWTVQWRRQPHFREDGPAATATAHFLDHQFQPQKRVLRGIPLDTSKVNTNSTVIVEGEHFMFDLYKVSSKIEYICISLVQKTPSQQEDTAARALQEDREARQREDDERRRQRRTAAVGVAAGVAAGVAVGMATGGVGTLLIAGGMAVAARQGVSFISKNHDELELDVTEQEEEDMASVGLQGIACELKDPNHKNHVMGAWSSPHALKVKESLLVAYFYRDGDLWNVRVVAQATPSSCLEGWQAYLPSHPPPMPPAPLLVEKIRCSMPDPIPYQGKKSVVTPDDLAKLVG